MVWRGAAPLPQKLCIDDNCVVYASWDNIIEKGGGVMKRERELSRINQVSLLKQPPMYQSGKAVVNVDGSGIGACVLRSCLRGS